MYKTDNKMEEMQLKAMPDKCCTPFTKEQL